MLLLSVAKVEAGKYAYIDKDDGDFNIRVHIESGIKEIKDGHNGWIPIPEIQKPKRNLKIAIPWREKEKSSP